ARERWDASGPGYRCCGGRREIVAEAHPAPAGPLAGTRFVSFEDIVASGPSPSIHPSLEGLLGANGEGRPGANASEGGRLRIRWIPRHPTGLPPVADYLSARPADSE